ncbi:MAG: antibiotic biosynthesis monooxygenase [Janthinobacterium lividum]
MVTIQENNTFTQIVRFDVAKDNQEALITAITTQVQDWVCRLPGFISSTFHASHDGQHVINYAQWQDESAFQGFLQDGRNENLRAAIHAVDAAAKPNAVHCRVVRSIESKA